MKRLLSIALALVLCLTLVPAALAADKRVTVDLQPSRISADKVLELKTESGNVLIPHETLVALGKINNGTLQFSLNEGVFSIKQFGRDIPFYNDQHPMLLSMILPESVTSAVIVDVKTGKPIPRCWVADGKVWAKIYKPGSYVAMTGSPKFTDTDSEAILALAARGVVTGKTPDTFAPEAGVKTCEFITMFIRMLSIERSTSASSFPDVAADAYYAKTAALAKELGIIQGDDKGNFNPDRLMTREQMFTMAVRAMDALEMWPDNIELIQVKYNDYAAISEYAQEPVVRLAGRGLLGDAEGTLRPRENATREEAAELLYNILCVDR